MIFDDGGISVSEFVGLLNETFELAYPIVNIVGELANFRVSKNKWVYFDLKDETSTLKFFGTVFQLRAPLEDGMMLKVASAPRMHNVYGFSMQVQAIELVGEGSLRRAAELLQIQLTKEGLFDEDRKRPLVYPPTNIGLITSSQSAAYHDFAKIINSRWRGLNIKLVDVQVQGAPAEGQIVRAIDHLNVNERDIEVIVIIRGGGSPEDLAVFSSEAVTRAVAASKVPTLVAIGHEIDISLAELAADRRASTPSNAAELLVPDRRTVLKSLLQTRNYLHQQAWQSLTAADKQLKLSAKQLDETANRLVNNAELRLVHQQQLVNAYNPKKILNKGYSVIRRQGQLVFSSKDVSEGDILNVTLARGGLDSTVRTVYDR